MSSTRFSEKFDGEYLKEAKKIEANFQAKKRRIEEDRTLNPYGRQMQIQQAAQDKKHYVGELFKKAADEYAKAQLATDAKVADAKTSHFEFIRSTLGDAITADLYLKALRQRDADGIREAYEDAAPGGEQFLIANLGRLILYEKNTTLEPDEYLLLRDLEEASVSPELAEAKAELADLESTKARFTELDQGAHQQQLADAFGVNVRYMSTDAE